MSQIASTEIVYLWLILDPSEHSGAALVGLQSWRELALMLFLAWTLADMAVALELDKLLIEAKGHHDWLITHRRQLHQWPELMFEEHNTSQYIRGRLDELGIAYKCVPPQRLLPCDGLPAV